MSRIKDKLWDIVEIIDEQFGEGYAKKIPELVGRIIQSEALIEGWEEVIHALRNVNIG